MLSSIWRGITCVWLLHLAVDNVVAEGNVLIDMRYGSSTDIRHLNFTEAMFIKLHTCLCEGRFTCYGLCNSSASYPYFQVIGIPYLGKPDTSPRESSIYQCRHTESYMGMTCTRLGMVNISEQKKITVFTFSKSIPKCYQKCVGLKFTHDDEGIHFSTDIKPFIETCEINCSCPALASPSLFSPTSSLELSSSSSSALSVTSSPQQSVTSSPEQSVTSSSSASISTVSPIVKTSQLSRGTTTRPLINRLHVFTDAYTSNTISASAGSDGPVDPTAHTSKAKDDNVNETPLGIIVGAVAGVIVVAVIVIVIVVMWKRRNREPKSSDYSSKTDSRSTSSGHTEENNNKRTHGKEPHYVNTTPSNKYQNTKVTNEHNVGNGSDNTILQQDDTDDNDDDFGYYTTHTISSGNHDGITNGTVSTKDTTETQPNRISDDYGYAYAEDQSSGDNVAKANKNGPSVVVAITQNINIKSSGDDYEDVYTGDEIASTDTKARGKNLEERDASPSKIPPMKTKEPEEEYAVVNKSQSVAKGDTTSESKDVYSKLHETERHITNPYDSLHHLNSSSNAENLPDSTHKLHSANQSSPYELARPIPGTSANENGRATEDFELVPVASSTGRKESDAPNKDQQNVGLQGKKQAKKLPYGPEDYAVVIKSKPNNKNKAAGFELGNK